MTGEDLIGSTGCGWGDDCPTGPIEYEADKEKKRIKDLPSDYLKDCKRFKEDINPKTFFGKEYK